MTDEAKKKTDIISKTAKIGCAVIFGFIVLVVVISAADYGRTPSERTETPQPPSNAFKLASLEIGYNNPSESLVTTFDNLLRRLQNKCPDESETQIANYIFKAQKMIEERGGTITLLQAGNSIDGSIPEEAAGAISCAEVAAAFVTLYTQAQ